MCIAFNMNSILYLNGIVSFLAIKTERATTTLLDSTKELTAISGEVLFLIGVQFQEEGGQFHGGGRQFQLHFLIVSHFMWHHPQSTFHID